MSETVFHVTSLGKGIKGKTILEDISFEINQGDCVALIGPNGAGKNYLDVLYSWRQKAEQRSGPH